MPARALAAGAAGVRVGTRFVAAEEPDAHPIYVAALLAAQPEDSIYQRTRLSAPGSNEDESRVARKGHDRTTRCRFLAYQAE